jgi:hypothetical protein
LSSLECQTIPAVVTAACLGLAAWQWQRELLALLLVVAALVFFFAPGSSEG